MRRYATAGRVRNNNEAQMAWRETVGRQYVEKDRHDTYVHDTFLVKRKVRTVGKQVLPSFPGQF